MQDNRILFIARKLKAIKWISSRSPSYEELRIQVNGVLLKEWQVYKNGGLTNKFGEMWGPWLLLPGLTPFILEPDGSIGAYRSFISYRIIKV